jgi:hypothetical protein
VILVFRSLSKSSFCIALRLRFQEFFKGAPGDSPEPSDFDGAKLALGAITLDGPYRYAQDPGYFSRKEKLV